MFSPGISLETAPRVIECVLCEFRDLKENPVPPEELARAKDHLKGSMMLSLESTGSRMSNLARQEKYFRKFITLDEVSERVQSVTAEEVQQFAQQWFHQERIAVAVLGALNGFTIDRAQLAC